MHYDRARKNLDRHLKPHPRRLHGLRYLTRQPVVPKTGLLPRTSC
jgi:hypothetical protein